MQVLVSFEENSLSDCFISLGIYGSI